MALADDVTTGGKKTRVDKEILAAAPEKAKTRPVLVTSSDTTPRFDTTTVRGANQSMHSVIDEIAMRAGALSTVPEIEPYFPDYEPTMGPLAKAKVSSGTDEERKGVSISNSYTGTYLAKNEPLRQQDFAVSEEDKEEAAARARETALGESKLGRKKVLGAEAYKDLKPDQKAAVDLNTLLSKAVQQDLRQQAKIESGDLKLRSTKEYDDAVDAVFGEDSSTTYAPKTVALLNSIGFETKDIDLDDFLKLKTAVTASELDGFSLEQRGGPDANLATPEHERTKMQEALVSSFSAMRTDPVGGENLLGLQRSLVGTNRQLGFGTQNSSGDAPMDQQLNAYFNNALVDVSRADKDDKYANEILGDVRANLTDEEWKAFVNFLDVRTREAMQYKRPLFDTMVDPETGEEMTFALARDVRKRLGF